MNEPLFMGVDGGGSALRAAIVDAELRPLATVTGAPVNPSIVGRDAAQMVIRDGIAQALRQARLQPQDIAAISIGVAGASNQHSAQWLAETVAPILPNSLLAPSSDLEIALVGALAQRHGILLLAGTGSAVYGAAPDGQQLQVGGWGYLLGDEGSGYWIGRQLLRHVVARFDEGAPSRDNGLYRRCLEQLGLSDARQITAWLYRAEEPPVARVAGLAELVLSFATNDEKSMTNDEKLMMNDEKLVMKLIKSAAGHLARQVEIMRSRLEFRNAPIAFAGGLLDNDNALSMLVAHRLGLPQRPAAQHPPVIGAALLAKEEWSLAKAI